MIKQLSGISLQLKMVITKKAKKSLTKFTKKLQNSKRNIQTTKNGLEITQILNIQRLICCDII
jgi:hypothetical protein